MPLSRTGGEINRQPSLTDTHSRNHSDRPSAMETAKLTSQSSAAPGQRSTVCQIGRGLLAVALLLQGLVQPRSGPLRRIHGRLLVRWWSFIPR